MLRSPGFDAGETAKVRGGPITWDLDGFSRKAATRHAARGALRLATDKYLRCAVSYLSGVESFSAAPSEAQRRANAHGRGSNRFLLITEGWPQNSLAAVSGVYCGCNPQEFAASRIGFSVDPKRKEATRKVARARGHSREGLQQTALLRSPGFTAGATRDSSRLADDEASDVDPSRKAAPES